MQIKAFILKGSIIDVEWSSKHKSVGSISKNKFKLIDGTYHCLRVINLPPLLHNESVKVLMLSNPSKELVNLLNQ